VSIGMFEHVGYKNYRRYFEVVRRCLAPDALFLLHTIGGRTSQTSYDPWFDRNIFPNSHIPSARQIARAAEGVFFVEDWHDIGIHYDRTLLAWYDNFNRAWPSLSARYGERFYRTWRCYLLASAGAFRARYLHTWQIVLAGTRRLDGYRASR
jgi:cyclopropane-fatty-acyl-phospholipid synthase